MRINTNMNAMIAVNQMAKNTALSGNSMEKLSSGLRITKAGDDAAGLAISEKMRSQIRGMQQADRNVQDGISMVQTAEGALEETQNIAQRMRELTVQGSTGTLTADDISKIDVELKALGEEIAKISTETKFNDKALLDGTNANVVIQAGANDETRTVTLYDLKTASDAVKDLKVTDAATSKASLTAIDTLLKNVSEQRATLGTTQNRLEYTSSNLVTSTENLSAAESRIRDVDVASEMVKLSKLNILTQASQAMVSQAKAQPESILQLLR